MDTIQEELIYLCLDFVTFVDVLYNRKEITKDEANKMKIQKMIFLKDYGVGI